MVDVSVGQDHGVQVGDAEGEMAVALPGFRPATLEEPTIQQEAMAVDGQEVHRAGNGACRAEELDLHSGVRARIIGLPCPLQAFCQPPDERVRGPR